MIEFVFIAQCLFILNNIIYVNIYGLKVHFLTYIYAYYKKR